MVNQKQHEEHQQWESEHAMWLVDIAMWQKEHQNTININLNKNRWESDRYRG